MSAELPAELPALPGAKEIDIRCENCGCHQEVPNFMRGELVGCVNCGKNQTVPDPYGSRTLWRIWCEVSRFMPFIVVALKVGACVALFLWARSLFHEVIHKEIDPLLGAVLIISAIPPVVGLKNSDDLPLSFLCWLVSCIVTCVVSLAILWLFSRGYEEAPTVARVRAVYGAYVTIALITGIIFLGCLADGIDLRLRPTREERINDVRHRQMIEFWKRRWLSIPLVRASRRARDAWFNLSHTNQAVSRETTNRCYHCGGTGRVDNKKAREDPQNWRLVGEEPIDMDGRIVMRPIRKYLGPVDMPCPSCDGEGVTRDTIHSTELVERTVSAQELREFLSKSKLVSVAYLLVSHPTIADRCRIKPGFVKIDGTAAPRAMLAAVLAVARTTTPEGAASSLWARCPETIIELLRPHPRDLYEALTLCKDRSLIEAAIRRAR